MHRDCSRDGTNDKKRQRYSSYGAELMAWVLRVWTKNGNR